MLVYRVGNSKEHRSEHLAWDGLLLHKDDPWWNSHFPPNGWGCKCWTQAISESRAEKLKQSGFDVSPSLDGNGYHVDVKTEAPSVRYSSYINDNTGTVGKVPAGVHPAFNFNIGRAGRDIPLFDAFMQKGKDGLFHPNIEDVAQTIRTNKLWWRDFDVSVKNAYSGTVQCNRAVAASFVDRKIAGWLKKNAGIDIGESVTISLEERLLNGPRVIRHIRDGNAVGRIESHSIIDALLYGKVYYATTSSGRAHGGNITYIFPYSENKFYKIIVNPSFKLSPDTGGKNSFITGPIIRSIDTIGEAGLVWVKRNNTLIK